MPTVRVEKSFEKNARKLLTRHPEKARRVQRTMELLADDPRHPSLRTKKYGAGQDVWQSYVENNTPSAWRIWWMWDPVEPDTIIVVAFGPHP
jgi:mRNA-degrading endonuclease YafQ of YafQ-DinJ toxin-antitoxin module